MIRLNPCVMHQLDVKKKKKKKENRKKMDVDMQFQLCS